MGKVYVFDHPLIQHKTSTDEQRRSTSVKDVQRAWLREIAMLMAI